MKTFRTLEQSKKEMKTKPFWINLQSGFVMSFNYNEFNILIWLFLGELTSLDK